MNSQPATRTSLGIYFIAALGATLIVGGLSWLLFVRTRPDTLNQARIAERIKNLKDITGSSTEALNNFGWQDRTKGLVRLPISNAMDLVVREWKNPAAGRSNLLARIEKAYPPPPPPQAFE
ncbi:MAG: hypothetical protein U1G07_16200 [Verrucomicrobiota bacterium]